PGGDARCGQPRAWSCGTCGTCARWGGARAVDRQRPGAQCGPDHPGGEHVAASGRGLEGHAHHNRTALGRVAAPVRPSMFRTRPNGGAVRVFANTQELVSAAGTDLGRTDWIEIDQNRIDLFADATNDHQWIHVDREKAAAGPFGAPIAHGYLSLSLLSHFSPQLLKVTEAPQMVINYGLNKVRFLQPVQVGSRVRDNAELTTVKETPKGVLVTVTHTVEIEGEERPSLVAEALGLWVSCPGSWYVHTGHGRAGRTERGVPGPVSTGPKKRGRTHSDPLAGEDVGPLFRGLLGAAQFGVFGEPPLPHRLFVGTYRVVEDDHRILGAVWKQGGYRRVSGLSSGRLGRAVHEQHANTDQVGEDGRVVPMIRRGHLLTVDSDDVGFDPGQGRVPNLHDVVEAVLGDQVACTFGVHGFVLDRHKTPMPHTAQRVADPNGGGTAAALHHQPGAQAVDVAHHDTEHVR